MSSEAASYFPGTFECDRENANREKNPSDRSSNLSRPENVPLRALHPENRRLLSADPQQLGSGVSDEMLLGRLQSGDREALAILFRRFARIVRSVAYRILRDQSEADDLLQDVFLFILRKAALFDASQGSARSWIVQVTYHRAIDRRRYLVSRHFYSSLELGDSVLSSAELGAETAFIERSIEGVVGRARLKRIAESLSEHQRQTIQLYFFEGYTLEEIAAQIGQSLGNVRNHYYRGLEKIRQVVFAAKLQAK